MESGAPGVPETQTLPIRGLTANTAYYLSQDGLVGVRILPSYIIALVALLPALLVLPLLISGWLDSIFAGATVWLVLATLVHDELEWRGLKRLDASLASYPPKERRFAIPWISVKEAVWNGRLLTVRGNNTNPSRGAAIAFDAKSGPAVERSLLSWGVRLTSRPQKARRVRIGFLTLIIVLFVVSQVILFSAALLPFFPGEEQNYMTMWNTIESQVSGASFLSQFGQIFSNNLAIALVNMVPGFGLITMVVASYNTGRIIQVAAMSQNMPAWVAAFTLFLFPHTWVEELSYPIAVATGLTALTWRGLSPDELGRRLDRKSVKFALALVVVTGTLTIAGLLEVSEPALGASALLLWIPVLAGAIYLLTTWWGNSRKQKTRANGDSRASAFKPLAGS